VNPLVANVLRWHVFLAEVLFGFRPRFLSGFRTPQQQLDLFRGVVFTPNVVAFPGTSQHEFGFAYDLAPDVRPGAPSYDARLAQLRDLGLALGMRWGGPQDPQHWQAFSLLVWQAIISARGAGAPPPRRGAA